MPRRAGEQTAQTVFGQSTRPKLSLGGDFAWDQGVTRALSSRSRRVAGPLDALVCRFFLFFFPLSGVPRFVRWFGGKPKGPPPFWLPSRRQKTRTLWLKGEKHLWGSHRVPRSPTGNRHRPAQIFSERVSLEESRARKLLSISWAVRGVEQLSFFCSARF